MAGEEATTRYTIGELSRLSGLSVKTIRFYSDEGLVPESARTRSGYRLYGREAADRLGFVRTLRDLGIDLATIRRVLAREVTVAAVAAVHAQAIDVQIRMLRLRRAVLRAVAERGSEGSRGANQQEIALMDKLVQVSNEERRRMVAAFLDDVFGGLDMDPDFEARMRSAGPELPEDPTTAQIEAWVELADLLAQPEFRRRVREMAQRAAADRAAGDLKTPEASAAMQAAGTVAAKAGDALARGIAPASPEAGPLLDEIVGAFVTVHHRSDSPEFRAWLGEAFDLFADRRVERYWQLLGIINGWPTIPSTLGCWEWTVAALRASPS